MVWLWLGFYHDDLSEDTRFKVLLECPREKSRLEIQGELYDQIYNEYHKANEEDDGYRGSLEIRGVPGILAYHYQNDEFFGNLDIDQIQQLADIAKAFSADEFEIIDDADKNATYLYDLYWCMWNREIEELLHEQVCKDVAGIVIEYLM